MFTSFPKISIRLLDTLSGQFRFYVKQDYGFPKSGSFLFSPFKEEYKALHYFERLNPILSPKFFNLAIEDHRIELYELARNVSAENSYCKIIEHNFKLDDLTRNKIAAYVRKYYPDHFYRMIKNNFRIVIGDNFGDVFYNIRIGQGVLLPVRESDLEKLSNYVQGPQPLL